MKYHFVGICGISMSALAVHLRNSGHIVQGSDINHGDMAKNLEAEGIKVFAQHNKNNIKDCDVLVYNFAIDENNEEIVYAKQNNIKIISRADLLEEISKEYKNVIAIAGSHGKTTTVAMMYSCLKCANLKPTLHIGGIIEAQKFGYVEGDKNYFVTEACEFHDSFLALKPDIGIILNIEPEHLDYFKTFDNEVNSYIKFANNCKDVIVTQDLSGFENITTNICAKNIELVNHRYHFDVYIDTEYFMHVDLNILGKYNIQNALCVIAAFKKLGIDKKYIYLGLKNAVNIKRRFEVIKTKPVLLVHDYAHHPTQVEKTIATFRECCSGKILVVFQPHTYSRTKAFFNQFLDCFNCADEIFILKTYAAREKYDKNASAFMLYKHLKNKKKCRYFADFKRAQKAVQSEIDKGFNVIFLGAGDIDELAYTF